MTSPNRRLAIWRVYAYFKNDFVFGKINHKPKVKAYLIRHIANWPNVRGNHTKQPYERNCS